MGGAASCEGGAPLDAAGCVAASTVRAVSGPEELCCAVAGTAARAIWVRSPTQCYHVVTMNDNVRCPTRRTEDKRN